ncbi:MFS transporter [Nitriliruptoraceae bacterium ZYF776]|nr:MFS transporter [Profundirhabdus halotolerans]
MRSVLARPAYRRLWTAQTVSRWGDVFNTVALAVLVFQLTGSGLGVTGVVVAEIIPVLLLAPVAGAFIDRLPAVKVMIAADVWRMGLALLLPLVADSVAAVYAVAFGLSAGAVFFNPASQATLPAVVDERELIAGNSGLWTAAVISQIVLAPLAGGMVAILGVTPAFLLNAATYAVSAVVLLRIIHVAPAAVDEATERRTWWSRAAEGVQVIATTPLLRLMASVQALAALSAGATSALLIVLATEHLNVGADGFGMLLSAIGVGAAIGPLVLTKLVSDPRRVGFVFGPFVLRGVVDLVLATFRSLPVALGFYGVGTSTGMVTFNSLLQAETTDQTRGRVFASFDAIWQLGRLVSLGVGGLLTDAAGISAVYYLGGVLLLLAGLAGLTRARPHGTTASTGG